jgi:nitrite reductase/ring-hydroxylating ferredoxin subunit
MNDFLCRVDELEDPGSKGFTVNNLDLFVVKHDARIYVYKNLCPHLGVNLEWQEDQFLDSDKNLIQCSTHGALFLIDNGNCVAGPCAGDKLKALPFYIKDGEIYLM